MTIYRFRLARFDRMFAVFPLLALSACGDPEVRVCEEFIQQGLKAPSTYKRVSVSKLDEPMTPQMMKQDHGRIDTFDKIWLEQGKLSRRQVAIEYDAENSFGVAIRGGEVCEFHLIDGELPEKSSLESGMRMAVSQRSLRELGRAGLIPNQGKLDLPEPKFGCCENWL